MCLADASVSSTLTQETDGGPRRLDALQKRIHSCKSQLETNTGNTHSHSIAPGGLHPFCFVDSTRPYNGLGQSQAESPRADQRYGLRERKDTAAVYFAEITIETSLQTLVFHRCLISTLQ